MELKLNYHCDECEREEPFDFVVVVGDEENFDSQTAYLCKSCLKEALSLIEEEERKIELLNKKKYEQHRIGKDKAIKLCETKWWEGKSHEEIVRFQLFTSELCCPFAVFHDAPEKTIGRPVFTHELGLNLEGIMKEYLGETDIPSLGEIINLIPKDKQIILIKD